MTALTTDQILAVAQVAAVIVAAIAILVSLSGIRSQLWLTTFAEYTRRYSEIMEGLPFEARRPGGNFNLHALPAGERDHVLSVMRRYLNLCSEELYLRQRRQIDRATWEIWRTGMRDTRRLPCFAGVWPVLRSEYDYFPRFVSFVESLMAGEPTPGSGG